jgi:hypothetical protein
MSPVPQKDFAMNTVFILSIVLGIIPVASVWFGADSRNLVSSDARSLVS